MLSVKVIRTLAELDTLGPQWNALLEKSHFNDIFLSWEWVSNWAKTCINGDRLLAIAVHDGDELIAIAPLWVQKVAYRRVLELRVLRPVGAGITDYFDLIVKAEDVTRGATVIWDHLFGPLRKEWDVFEFFEVPETSPVLERFKELASRDTRSSTAKHVRYTKCPYIHLNGGWEELLASFRRTNRYTVRCSRRRLADVGDLCFDLCEKDNELPARMKDLIALNKKSWKARGGSTSFGSDEIERFHHSVSRALMDKEILFLATMTLDGLHIGSFYGFDYNDKLYYYISAVQPLPVKRTNVLTALLGFCIEEAARRGRHEFDLLRGDEPYKRQWTGTTRRNESIRVYNKRIRSGLLYLYRVYRRILARSRV